MGSHGGRTPLESALLLFFATAFSQHAAETRVLRNAPARSSPGALVRGGLERVRDSVKWAIPVAAAAIGICTTSIHDRYFSEEKRFARLACKAKISPQILDKSAMPYVARAQADAALGAFVATPGKFITIVVGPRGVGKTTAVAHALEHIDGAIMVKVTGEHTRDTMIYAELVKEVLGAPSSSTDALSNTVSRLCATSKRRRLCTSGSTRTQPSGSRPSCSSSSPTRSPRR